MSDEATLVDAPRFPHLVVMQGGRVIQEVSLRLELSIGRAEDNDLRLDDLKASRHHARIRRDATQEAYVLTDLGSANGTWVNEVRLAAPHSLSHGDRITIGDTEIRYDEVGASFADTITAPGLKAFVECPEIAPAPPAPARRLGKPLTAVLAALAGLLLLVAALFLLLPALRERIGLTNPTEMAVPATTTATAAGPDALTVTPEGPGGAAPVLTLAPQGSPAAAGTPGELTNQELAEWLSQAEALTRRSKFEEAMAIYRDLARRTPEDARPEVGLAWALLWDDRPDEGLDHALRAVELDPSSADAASALAHTYVGLGDKAAALTAAQTAIDLNPGNASALASLAEALLLDGQVDQAIEKADLALVQSSNEADAHAVRGWLYYLDEGDVGRAAGELQIAAGLQPELWLRRHELGSLLLQAGDNSTALIAFQDALQIHPKARTYSAIGEAYYRLRQYDQARAALRQALTMGAEDLDTYARLGATYAQQGQCDEAKPYYEQALALDDAALLAIEAQELCQGAPPAAGASPSPSAAATTPQATRPPAPAATLTGRIAFPVWNREASQYDTYVAKADGSGRTLVVAEMHQPDFSPDGEWIAVNGERHEHLNLFLVRPNGSELKEITQNIEDALPEWSPNGSSLAFSSTKHGDKQSRVYVLDEVPFVGQRQGGRALNFGPDEVRGEYPAWAAGRRIVYKGCDSTVDPAKCGLFILSADPGPHPYKQLTDRQDDTAPAAFENRIAFMSTRDGNWEIYVMNDDGSDMTRLTTDPAEDGLPTWSPDGKTIAFVSKRGGSWAVWAIDPDGKGAARKLFDIGDGGLASDWQHEKISWAP